MPTQVNRDSHVARCSSGVKRAQLALGLALLALLVAGCRLSSPVFTPDPKDPSYHCHAADGSVIADGVWCLPEDGSHTCCPAWHTCNQLDGQPVCAYAGSDAVNANSRGTYAARKPVKRTPESGR